MQNGKTVILTKTHYKTAEAAKILSVSYTPFYQLCLRRKLFTTVNEIRFIHAETIIQLFKKYRPFDDCIINFDAPEVY